MKKHLVISIAVILGVITFLPFLWMISASFMSTGAANTYPPKLLPEKFDFSHYQNLFTRLNLTKYLFNSMVISLGVTFFSLLLNSMAGYAFAK